MFALTPDGDISACYEVFDATSPRHNIFFYGKMNDDTAPAECHFDAKRVAFLRSQSVENRPFCKGCFARWSCGGDCFHKSLTVYGDGEIQGTERCNIIRELTKDQILARINKSGGIFWHEAPDNIAVPDNSDCTCVGCNG